MKQYLNLLQEIKDKGTVKPAARAGMPSTLSLFGATDVIYKKDFLC